MKKIRLDTLLVERGAFADEAEALRAVLAHEVKVGDEYATSAAMRVAPDADVEVKGRAAYVSRGGLKLREALDEFDINVSELHCIDVGCSTGGFTDCLLQAGAASVAAVDVGYGDFAWKLRTDPRVTLFERTNIKTASPEELGAPFDFVVADLSFVGLAGLAPVFATLCRPGSLFVGLVKPQFESRYDEVDDRGYVSDESVRHRVVSEVQSALEAAGFLCNGIADVVESPIKGAKSHNTEYLVRARMRDIAGLGG